jgi:hypothetical protein
MAFSRMCICWFNGGGGESGDERDSGEGGVYNSKATHSQTSSIDGFIGLNKVGEEGDQTHVLLGDVIMYCFDEGGN